MSKKLCLLLFGALTGAMVVNAAVGPGENLILNGNLEAEQLEFPQF